MVNSNKPMRKSSKFISALVQRAVVWCETAQGDKPNGLLRAMWKKFILSIQDGEKHFVKKCKCIGIFPYM